MLDFFFIWDAATFWARSHKLRWRSELEEEDKRESKWTDVLAYSEGTFKGNNWDTEKNSKREFAATLTHLKDFWQTSLTRTHHI